MAKETWEVVGDFEITDRCSMEPEEKSRLRYAIGKNGMVAIVHYRNLERNNGSFGFYSLNKLDEALARDYFFHRHARLLGITPELLHRLILDNKPAIH